MDNCSLRALHIPRQQQRQHGQNLVEIALVMGILFLLVFGGIDAVQHLLTLQSLERAARAAVFEAAVRGSGDGAEGSLASASGEVAARARLVLDNAMTADSHHAQITVYCPQGCRRYAPITVQIDYTEPYWAPIGPFTTIRTRSIATRLAEQDPHS